MRSISIGGDYVAEKKAAGEEEPQAEDVKAVLEEGDREAEKTMKAEETKDEEFNPDAEETVAAEQAGTLQAPKSAICTLCALLFAPAACQSRHKRLLCCRG